MASHAEDHFHRLVAELLPPMGDTHFSVRAARRDINIVQRRQAVDINQMLQQTGAVDAISRELGVDASTAEAGAIALLPSILSSFQNPVAAAEPQTAASAFPGLG